MPKMTIHNTAEGARGVLLADGTTHFVEPGQTAKGLDVAKDHQLYDGLKEGEGPAPADADEADNDGEGEQEPGPLDGSIADLAAHVATVDDQAEIERLIEGETAGKSRSGALTVLNERLDALKGGE